MGEFNLEYWHLPREPELMLSVALRQPVQGPDDIDWERFDAALRQHRVQPLLIRGLRGKTDLPPELDKYRTQQNKYAMQSLNRLQALAQVNAALAAEGVRMISMKGPLLSMELYGDPSLRTSRDLDVMVAEEDLPRAGELLTGLGYEKEQDLFHTTPLRRSYYSAIEPEKHEVYNKGDICIELHWKSNYQTEQSFDELWDRREERTVLGRPIAVMGTADRWPALFIHAAEHGFLRLRWLLDLYELQKKPNFSWEAVYGQMRSQGVGELLIETLLVMHRLRLPGLSDVSWDGFSLTKEETGVRLTVSDTLAGEAQRAVSLCDAVYPLLLREVKRTEREWKSYDRQLPTCINQKTLWQSFLIACGPSVYEFQLVDLPDWLFPLYFLIRPFHWLWRKLTGK